MSEQQDTPDPVALVESLDRVPSRKARFIARHGMQAYVDLREKARRKGYLGPGRTLMSTPEIKAAAEEILQRHLIQPFDEALNKMTARGEPPIKHEATLEAIAAVAEIITKHFTPTGAEEAADKAADSIIENLISRREFGCVSLSNDTLADLRILFEKSALSAIQSVHPEIAVMEELYRACKAAWPLLVGMCSGVPENRHGPQVRIQVTAALAHAEEVMNPHEEAERKE